MHILARFDLLYQKGWMGPHCPKCEIFFYLWPSPHECIEAIVSVWTTSCGLICPLLPKKGGMYRETQRGRRSCIVKPFSAMTELFSVVWFLYELKSSLFRRRLLGIRHRTSVQSMITLAEGYLSLKSAGLCSSTFALDGHTGTVLILKNTKFTQEITMRLCHTDGLNVPP